MKMNYFVVGTRNMALATAFYDAFFDGAGLCKLSSGDRMTYWKNDDYAFAIALPFDGQPATNGNGVMVGFSVGSVAEVKRLHQKSIDLGATCEGEPNHRGPYFSAYVRDLDGNKICISE